MYPELKPQDIVSYCGICQSDITIWNPLEAFKELIPLPHVLGHEIAGYIHQLAGDGEDEGLPMVNDADKIVRVNSSFYPGNLAVGDRVGVFVVCQCGGSCGHCKDGQEPLCEFGSQNVIGVTICGGYASHVLVPNKKFIVKLPDNIPTQVGAVVGCAGITSYSAVCEVKETANKNLKLKGKSSLLLIGCGGLGQWAIIAAKAVLPGVKVVVADINGGLMVLIGISNNNIASNFPTALFLQRGYTLKGRSYGTLKEYKELMEILGKAMPPKLPGIKLFDFENATDALELVKNGEISSRAVLKIAE